MSNEPSSAKDREPGSQGQLLRGRRALVADDSEAAREILKRILERAGMQVLAVADGADAVDLVRSDPTPFDLVVLDLVMEKMGGIEAAVAIRQTPGGKACAIVAVSATSSPELRAACMAAGASGDIVLKPFRTPDVLTAAQRALQGKAAAPTPAVDPGPAEPDTRAIDFTGVFARGIDLTEKAAPADGNQRTRDPGMDAAVDIDRGIDITGALERFGEDTDLLRRLLQNFAEGAMKRVDGVIDALDRNNPQLALKGLHNLRGDTLNLGMSGSAARLSVFEMNVRELLAGGRNPSAGPDGGVAEQRSALRKQLKAFSEDVAGAALLSGQLPRLNDGSVALASGNHRPEASKAVLSEMVQALLAGDPRARTIASRHRRLLPASYAYETEQLFRQHVESFDFNYALRLLQREDVDVAQAPVPDSGAYRILVVDSSALSLMLICRTLEGLGALRFAFTAGAALEIALDWLPDLVLIDVALEDLPGVDLCRRLKKFSPTAGSAVIMLSSDNDFEAEVAAVMAGAVDFVQKPLNPARVAGRVITQLAAVSRNPKYSTEAAAERRAPSIGFVTCTPAGRILEVDPGLARMLETSAAVLRGSALRELFDPSDARALDRALANAVEAGRVAPLEASLAAKRGAAIAVRLVGWMVPTGNTRMLWLSLQRTRAET